ncbi:hypothetical protein [Clostridium chromiireducens]|uniref:hypothetical protein n=1 Tax=Clostridium chromiireducens TaxID=225345 RepID=UPI001922F744|nr:hypothetical protein [Clostridium chromiireducens]
MTSNFGAIGFSDNNPNIATTEKYWTPPNEKGLSAFEKSKLLAELAAWDFIKKEGYPTSSENSPSFYLLNISLTFIES